MECIAIGDLHFDGRLASLIDNHHLYIGREVDKACAWARKRGISNVILLGDVCDSPRMSYESQIEFANIFRRNADLSFFVILGNHDKFAKSSDAGHSLETFLAYNAFSHVKVLVKPKTVNIDGTAVRFLPWPSLKFDKRALNIAHREVKGTKSDSGRVFKEGPTADKGVGVVGHLHTKQKVGTLYYPGTLYQDTFGQKPEKYFAHIRFESPKDFTINFIPHRPRYELRNIVVSSKRDLKQIPDDLNVLVKLIIQDGADVNSSMWATYKNVVDVTGFKTQEELYSAITEDDGASLKVSIKEFLVAWFEEQGLDAEVITKRLRLRKRILHRGK